MPGKTAAMTREQMHAAGYSVLRSATIGAKHENARPWIIQRNHPPGIVLDRYVTRYDAVAALHFALTDPDGALFVWEPLQ